MPPRATWKGFLNLSLVSVAVKAYTANNTTSTVRLNQLHEDCNSRIKLVKTCPIHGELSSDEIVKGYEFAKDQYVVIDEDELDKLRSPADHRSIAIETFVSPNQIDPIYFSDSNYYLLPDGPAGQKSYAVLYQAMVDSAQYGVARVVLNRKEQVVLLRPLDDLLCMTVLKYAAQVKPTSLFDDERPEASVSEAELELAKLLIEKTTVDDFDLESFKDAYTENLTKLIEAKVNGDELVAPPEAEPQTVINLMDALKASVSATELPADSSGKPAAKASRKSAGRKKAEAATASSALEKQLARKSTAATKKASSRSKKKKTG